MAKTVSPLGSSGSEESARSRHGVSPQSRVGSPFSRWRSQAEQEHDPTSRVITLVVLMLIISTGILWSCDMFCCPIGKKLISLSERLHAAAPQAGGARSTAGGDAHDEPTDTANGGADSFYAAAGSFRCPQPQRYSREEVARHHVEDDLWIVVDGNVLDVSSFVVQHPGGSVLLDGAGGHDMATEFARFHEPSTVSLFASFCIGRIRGQ
ncbi:Cytochrome b5-like Heme/Steroid binding domain containing protein [Novymonas esmeraldas]|uniref:Cytochrome b5-like Heme/Steroid binding domain containing protein n=1 Tax=Novymonas esmeraldas TaxID=1808958 RepID=A0AAW0ERV9_9TRYP